MRPYRGLTKDGKWVKGWYVGEGYQCARIIPTEGGYGSYGSTDENKEMIGPVLEVIPETVGQSTGFKSMHSKEIYQGDKLRLDEEEYVVAWCEDGYWGLKDIPDNEMKPFSMDKENWDEFEIIGNIHDKESAYGKKM